MDRVVFENSQLPAIPASVFDQFPSLVWLEAPQTKLPVVSNLRHCDRLLILVLDHNHIASINGSVFQRCPNLLWINLSSNGLRWISSDAFDGLPALKILYLHNNTLETLEPTLFDRLIALEEIHLELNKLLFVGAQLFANNVALRFVFLSYNRIALVESHDFLANQENLQLLDLSGNLCVNRQFANVSARHADLVRVLSVRCFRNWNALLKTITYI